MTLEKKYSKQKYSTEVKELSVRYYADNQRYKTTFISLVIVYLVGIAWSPIFPGYAGIRTTLLYVPILLACMFYLLSINNVSIRVLMISLLLTLGIVIVASITQSQTYFNRYITLPISLITCSLIVSKNKEIIARSCDYLSIFAIFGVILSLISFAYAFFGGEPSSFFLNPDGRENFFYLSSFSNAVFDNVIRPGFIYDEPGAFSFFLCFVVILRELLNRKKIPTYFILIGGLVTFSVTHLIIVFLYFLFNIKIIKVLFIAVPITFGVFQASNIDEFAFFFDRFVVVNGSFSGDNRSNQIENFIAVADADILLFGDYKCHDLPEKYCSSHGDLSSSLVTPVYYGGIIQLLVQVITHSFFIYAFFKHKKYRFVSLAMSLLLMQRPYFSSLGYQLMIYIVIFLLIFDFKKIKLREKSTANGGEYFRT